MEGDKKIFDEISSDTESDDNDSVCNLRRASLHRKEEFLKTLMTSSAKNITNSHSSHKSYKRNRTRTTSSDPIISSYNLRQRNLTFQLELSSDSSENETESKTSINKHLISSEKLKQLKAASKNYELMKKDLTDSESSCCHRCKRISTKKKVVCSKSNCLGYSGKFCGSCLSKFFDENLETALSTTDWVCPACRGLCKCTLCNSKALSDERCKR